MAALWIGLLSVLFFHPDDRPLADVTVRPLPMGVQVVVMLNFRFIDDVLGTAGNAEVVPSKREVEKIWQQLRSQFGKRNKMWINGNEVVGTFSDFEVAEPQSALIERVPELARPLTQVRFVIDYVAESPRHTVDMEWGFYPEHPLYDVPDSPVAPMEMSAVLELPAGAQVVKFSKDDTVQRLVLPRAKASSCCCSESAASKASELAKPTLRLGWLFAAGFLLVGFGTSWRRGRMSVRACALVVVALCLVSCGPTDALVKTESYAVKLTTEPVVVPTNKIFSVEIVLRALSGRPLPTVVHVDADMPEHKHGMNTKPRVTHLGGGRWRAEGMLFHMGGAWEIYVYLGKGASMERAVFPVVPNP